MVLFLKQLYSPFHVNIFFQPGGNDPRDPQKKTKHFSSFLFQFFF